ncbi:MAG: type II secretion system F family protein [Lachnoanaerobaculum saburreum]
MSMIWKKKSIKKSENLRTNKNCSQQAINYDSYSFTFIEWLKYSFYAVGILSLISYVFYKSVIIFFVLLPFCFLYPKLKKKELIVEKKRRLLIEFKEAVMILSSLLNAGYSLENSVKEALVELRLLYVKDNLIIKEFEYICQLIYMNISVERAFDDLAYRSHCEDIRSFAKVLRIAKRSGGELESIIAHTVSVIGDKVRIKEEIITMTAAKRFEQKVMNILPLLIVLYIDFSSPGFFNIMYTTIIGRMCMSVGLTVYLFAIYISKRLLNIEV